MAERSTIEWTDATWNPITGCSIVSPGCTNCYAMRLAGTRLRNHPSRKGLTEVRSDRIVWNGKVRLNRNWLYQPIEWKKPRRIFVCAHGDLFAEGVGDEWILDVFTVMAIAGHHTFQVLTKRPARMAEFLSRRDLLDEIYANWSTFSGSPREVYSWPLHNVWVGVSAERHKEWDARKWHLANTPAKARFVSFEPLLGPIVEPNLSAYVNQAIVGGESGPDARPLHPDWVRSLRDQSLSANVAFFFKQWGAWSQVYDREVEDPDWRRCDIVLRDTPRGQWLNLAGGQGFHGERVVRVDNVGKKAAGRSLDGRTHDEFPTIAGASA
jgi:protein gp37